MGNVHVAHSHFSQGKFLKCSLSPSLVRTPSEPEHSLSLLGTDAISSLQLPSAEQILQPVHEGWLAT